MDTDFYLPLIWAGVIGFAVAMYVILDGFDLGIGILFPTTKNETERDQAMTSVAPFWDGNETWLVLGGVGLLVAFPRAYAVIMPAFYLPVIVMLLALVFRGITFEFRGLATSSKPRWNFAFAAGSTVAAFCQGVILGGFLQGIKVADGQFAGGVFDFATPFALVCGLGVTAGYALLGATWLVMKTSGKLAARARAQAKLLLLVVLGFMAMVSLWTPLAFERIAERWFSLPNILFLWPVPIVTAAVAFAGMALAGKRPRRAAVLLCDRAFPARLSRACGIDLSLPGAAGAHDLASRRRAFEPNLHAGGHAFPVAAHSRLHLPGLLAIPRESARGRKLPLTFHCAAACGRIKAQPMRNTGNRAWKRRSKARGNSGTRSG